MKKLLVIGGTGVLSTAVVQEALTQGIDVTIINRGNRIDRIPNGAHLLMSDVHDEQKVKELLADMHFDSVIDFICYNKQQLEYSVNLFKNIADQYVFISTTCVYNAEISGIKTEDFSKVLKSWSYSVNKWKCEEFLAEYSKEKGLNYTVVRPCVTYDFTRIPFGIMPGFGYHWTLVERIKAGKPIITWNGGNNKWNLMRVEDFAIGVVGLLGKPETLGNAYNVCGDEAYSWNQVLKIVGDYVGKEVITYNMASKEFQEALPEMGEEISGRALDYVCSNEKLKKVVPNYGNTYDLEQGIKKTLDYYREHNFEKGMDYGFDGRIDGIIQRDIKKNKGKLSKYKLGFVDYLGDATTKDKLNYRLAFIHNKYLTKFFRIVERLI